MTMSTTNHHHTSTRRLRQRTLRRRQEPARWARCGLAAGALAVVLLSACGSDDAPSAYPTAATAPASAPHTMPPGDHAGAPTMDVADRAAAQRATAPFQDVAVAEAAGYQSSLATLGCFQDPDRGGMGVHYIDQSLMDGVVDAAHPEALVYELDARQQVVGLVAHEYIVPVEAWTAATPPELFGMSFHRHPTLPLWVLHTWLWKDNPTGMFQDWNPAVRPCPHGVLIFGTEQPSAATTTPSTVAG
jgi:hypothetical protein